MGNLRLVAKAEPETVGIGEETQADKVLDAALDYVRRGWAVLPLYGINKLGACSCGRGCGKDAGKHPITKEGKWQRLATESEVQEVFGKCWLANVGIITGASGLVAIDIDPRNGGSLEQVYSLTGKVETLTAQTGSGGWHLLFQAPSDAGMKFKKNLDDAGIKGVDIKAGNAYIVAAPSNHKSGGLYRWLDESVSVAEMPAPLIAVIRKDDSEGLIATAGHQAFQIPDHVTEGMRDDVLTQIAGKLRHWGFKTDEITDTLEILYRNRFEDGDDPKIRRDFERIARSIGSKRAERDLVDEAVSLTEAVEILGGGLSEAEEFGDVEPNYLIHGLEPGEVGAIFAAVNVGKSCLARNICLSLSAGKPYLNLIKAVDPVKTLILNFEGGRRRFYREFRAMVGALDSYEQELVRKNVRFILHDNPEHRVAGRKIDLKHEDHRSFLIDYINRHGFKVVVVDTITAAIQFKSENSNEEWHEYTKWLENIAVETSSIVLFVHHEGKRGLETAGQSAPRAHRGRGGSANSQLAQLVINLEAKSEGDQRYVVLGLGKLKDEPVDDLVLQHSPDRWLTEISFPGPEKPQSGQERVLEIVRTNPEGLTRQEIADKAFLTKESVKTIVWRLKKDKFPQIIERSGKLFPATGR